MLITPEVYNSQNTDLKTTDQKPDFFHKYVYIVKGWEKRDKKIDWKL